MKKKKESFGGSQVFSAEGLGAPNLQSPNETAANIIVAARLGSVYMPGKK